MAVYEVTAPDGTVYEVEGPDNASEKDLVNAVRRQIRQEQDQSITEEAERQKALIAQRSVPPPMETTFGGQALELVKGVPAGAIGLLESSAIGGSALLPESLEQPARAGIEQIAGTLRRPFAPAPGYEDTIPGKFGQAGGSTIPLYLLGALGGPLGLAGAVGLTAAAGAGEARVRAEQAGADPEQIRTSTQFGVGVGLSEMLPVAKFTKALGKAGTGTLVDQGKRILSQAGVEGLQEWAAAVAQNLIAKGVYDPEQGVFTETGEDLGYGAGVGGFIQGITELVAGRRVRRDGRSGEKKPPEEELDTEDSPEAIIRRETQGLVPDAPIEPVPPPAPVVTPPSPLREQALSEQPAEFGDLAAQDESMMRAELESLETGVPPAEVAPPVAEPVVPPEIANLPEGAILQNRDRSSPVAIEQMNDIANKPDYGRLGFSNSFPEGAPVVFGAQALPESQLGRKGTITTSKGRKIPIQYAVISASNITPSNRVDGTSIPQYADLNIPGFKAITNGRVAGLQEAYSRNTISSYLQEMIADDIHGISPEVIKSIPDPILVRIMPADQITKDIADESNTSSTMALSPSERAKNDARRISLDDLTFDDDGYVNTGTVKDFVMLMPLAERNDLIDKQGRPTRQAYERLNDAIFSKAYQNDSLISLAVEAKNEEVANIMRGLSQAGPQMAQLAEKGEYDIRPQVIGAAEAAINARRRGVPLREAMSEQDMLSQDPIVDQILNLFANNPRSAKKIGEGLRRVAEAANAEAISSQEPDMFGQVTPRRPIGDVVSQAIVDPESVVEPELLPAAPEAPIAETQISPEQQKAEVLQRFESTLSIKVPSFKAKFANGREYTLRPRDLTGAQKKLLLEIADSLITDGMPSSLLDSITAAGATNVESSASIAASKGWLMLGKDWAKLTNAEQTRAFAHEVGHLVDFGPDAGKFSNKEPWARAHQELSDWFTKDPSNENPMSYPFSPVFRGKVDILDESFAQSYALYFTDPESLQSNAPEAYSQIRDIVQGIQNESQTRTEGSQAEAGDVGIPVRQARSQASEQVQPVAGEVSPVLGATEQGGDRGAGQVDTNGLKTKEGLESRNDQIVDEKITDAQTPLGEKLSTKDFVSQAKELLANRQISQEVYDVVNRMLKKNPKFLDGLSLSTPIGEAGIQGQFDRLSRTIMLFKDYGSYDAGTLRHELTHSMEQMMPEDARKAVFDKWKAELKKAKDNDKSEQAQKYFKAVEDFVANPSRELLENAYTEMPSYEYYQFLNPSEYWAVNAEPLMKSYLGGAWQRFKTSIRGLVESIKDTLGLDNQSIIYQTFKDTINGERRDFSSISSYIGAGIPLRNIARKNYAGNPAPPATWETPPEATTSALFGKLSVTKFRQKFQDKMIDLKDAEKAIEKSGKEIQDFMDAYTKETLYYGKVATATDEFLRTEVRPILKEMQEAKVSPEQMDAYLLAKHAPERNKRIAEINPKFADGGSGITTAQAEAYLNKLPPERKKQLESINKKIRDIIEKTQEIEVKSGLEDRKTIDTWRSMWGNYVPLFRAELDYVNGGSGLGRGFDTRGPSSKRAVGSTREVKSILNSIFEQREKAVVRAGKNEVVKGLYALSIANPNPDFWLPINPDAVQNQKALEEELGKLGIDQSEAQNLMQEPKVATVVRLKDPQTGEYYETVKYISSPNAKFSDNVIGSRVNGKNRYVVFNPNNERANRLSQSLKNLDTEQLDFLTQKVGNVTRWIASMSTQYNPIFGIWNFTRDLQGSALNLSTTPLKGKQAQVISDAFKFLPEMYKEYRAARRGESVKGDVADLLRRFRAAGGQTGYREQFTKAEKKGTILQRELQNLNAGNVRKVVNAVGGWLSDYNDTLENAVRLAAFKQALDMDLSDQKAASIAKELTVNFNRKGSKTPGLSALFAFFNAAVQGTARMVETFAGPAGRKIMAGGMLLGAVQAMVLMASGFDEDEPTEFMKQKNLIIPTGNGTYLMWPMPLGFNFLPNVGRILTEMTFDGKTKARDRVVNLIESMSDSFNPLGGAGFLQTLSPTILDPFVAVIENQDAFGRPVSREDMKTKPSPGYLRSRNNSSEFSKLFSEMLNSMSGGTRFTKGIVSPTADDLDYIIGQYLGGVGREAQKIAQIGKAPFTGEDIETYRIPLFGKIYGTTQSPAAVSSKFYRTITRMSEHEDEIKGRMKEGEDVTAYIDKNPEARLYKAANRVENQISKINTRLREIEKEDRKDFRIELLKESRLEIMKNFLENLAEISAQ